MEIDKIKKKRTRAKKVFHIPKEYENLDDAEITRRKKIGDMMQSVEKGKIQLIKYKQAEKSVIDTKVATSIVTEVLVKLKSILYGSTTTLTSRIVGKSHAEVSRIMFEFIDDSLLKATNDFEEKIENINVEDIEEDEE